MKYSDLKTTGVKAKNYYDRGCTRKSHTANFDKGCITTSEGGLVCYQGCNDKDKCNNDIDLTNSAGSASIGFLATILYMLS